MEMFPLFINLAQYTAHIRGPICCAIDFRPRFLHLIIILLEKHLKIGLYNKADLNYKRNCLADVYPIFK